MALVKHIYDERNIEVFHAASTDSVVGADEKTLQVILDEIIDSAPIINVDSLFPKLNGFYSKYEARKVVPRKYRKLGLIITYKISEDKLIFELFIGLNLSNWTEPSNWSTIKGLLDDDEDAKYLSSDHDDVAKGNILFEKSISVKDIANFTKGINIGEFKDSIISGTGTHINDNLIQTNDILVRGSITEIDKVINEIHAMEGEYNFTDCGKIDSVEFISDNTYKLHLKPATEFDIISLKMNDILYSIINNFKLGKSDYYTSWFRVAHVDLINNYILVILYRDEDVPGGKNYTPMSGFNLTRHGNAFIPDEGAKNIRSDKSLLSTKDGRIMFLTNVYKPILEDWNYSISIGKFPDITTFEQAGINGETGIYALIIACEKLLQVDANGKIVPRKIDRGTWSLKVAQSENPYRYIYNRKIIDGKTKFIELEQHCVYYNGCKWGCIKDKTIEEPSWNCQDWIFLEGDDNYYVTFDSTRGWAFHIGNIDTTLTAHVIWGSLDITKAIMDNPNSTVRWSRDTGFDASDNEWMPNTPSKNTLRLLRTDMGALWGESYRDVMFKCTIYFPSIENQGETEITENSINIKI